MFKSREFKGYLAHRGIGHKRIHPHCPEEQGIIERGVRTVKELAGDEQKIAEAREYRKGINLRLKGGG